MWWIISTVLAFWICVFVGRYLYDDLVGLLALESRDDDVVARLVVVGIGCYVAFSAGASNVANAVAPPVGSGQLGVTPGAALGGLAIGAGAFLIGPRTMETVGEDVTNLSLEASLIVEVIAASFITALGWAGIPASLAVVLTACVIGLGWGRASRRVPLRAIVRPEGLTGEERATWAADQLDLYDHSTVKRVVATWVATPTVAGVVAYAVFTLVGRLQFVA
jgi:PiT family inorganic phosphate transporter